MKKTIWTVTAICLAAVLLCTGICFGTAAYVRRETAVLTAEAQAPAAEAASEAEGSFVSAAYARSVTGTETLTAAEIYDLACRQVVGISTTVTGYNMFGQLTSNAVSGTGFVLTEDGYILTNYHVVEDALRTGSTVTVKLSDGSEHEAEIVGVEGTDNDIALLKIDARGLTPVTLGDSDEMQVGRQIYVVGNPLGELTYTMTSGIISALDREIAAERNVSINMFQLDAAINSGNSGGPVYNELGQVIGVVTAKYNSAGVEGLGFAIPINDARAIAEELKENGYVTGKAYLGIVVTDMGSEEAQRYNTVPGVYVYSIAEGSCAEKAGMQQGDIIVELGGTAVETKADLAAAKKEYKAGDSCEIRVYRAGKYQTLTVVFDEEPAQTAALPETQPGIESLPSPAPRETPEGGESSESPRDEPGSYGSFDEWMNDLFGRFSEFFGGESSEDSDESSDSESGRSYRHFGG